MSEPTAPAAAAAARAAPSWRRNVYVLAAVHFVSGAAVSLVMPFLPLYLALLEPWGEDHLELWAGLAYSLPALAMMLTSPLWGALGDRFGRKSMLVRSTAGGAAMLLLMSMCTSVVEFALLRFLQGALMGTLAASNALVATSAPPSAHGRALGLLRTSSWVGLGAGPFAGGVLADAVGHRPTFLVGAMLLGLATLALLALVREQRVVLERTTERSGLRAKMRALLRPALLRLYLIDLLSEMARFLVVPVIPLLLLQLSGDAVGVATLAGSVLGVRAFAGAAGAYAGGRLGDRVGQRRTVLIAALVGAGLSVPQAFVDVPAHLAVLQAATAAFGALVVPTVAALLAREVHVSSMGATFGLGSSFQSAGRFLGPMVGMALVPLIGLEHTFLVAAALFVAIGALGLGLRGGAAGCS